ncbi:Na/Pi-cotransporter II-related protein [Anaerobiospirillum thomasii]|uniref:Na/Pi cotransporter family protein n=1 Tax=Anaerobiospirillum thomasii TaxID=179995 RepID=UPI000D82F2F2|nr:Na/Pi symporter [Anaerobiospirillum thomasii]SPT71996.1 Na/Pi-cotransporter II-related protein [Anaerobiospirillum thomasii]
MHVILNLLSGVALLAFAIHVTKKGVLRAFGYNINASIKRALDSRLWPLRAMLSGVFTTFLVQSSNATALLVSSFLSKGLISLSPALVIMLGADLGTALIARVLTLDISVIQPVFLLTGSFFYLYSKKTLSGRIGFILIGLGLILLSLSLIMEAARPVLENEATKTILQTVNGILPAAFIFGAVLAIICYSSLAAVILTALSASSGILDLHTALIVVVGANLGSCVLEIIGSISCGVQAKRVMLGNTMFKTTITLTLLPFLESVSGYMILLDSTMDAILWFHVLFNLCVCVLLMPFVSIYARLLQYILPDPKDTHDIKKPKYLDSAALETPSLAISNAIRETIRLGGYLHEMLYLLSQSIESKQEMHLSASEKSKHIEALGNEIKKYINDIEFENDEHLTLKWHQTLASVIHCMQASEIILRTIIEVEQLNANPQDSIPQCSRSDLLSLTHVLNEDLSFALNAFMTGSKEDEAMVMLRREEYKALIEKYSLSQLTFLTHNSSSSADISAFVMMLLSQLRQLDNVFCSIAVSGFARKTFKHHFDTKTLDNKKP